jgi:hypothetical protein
MKRMLSVSDEVIYVSELAVRYIENMYPLCVCHHDLAFHISHT